MEESCSIGDLICYTEALSVQKSSSLHDHNEQEPKFWTDFHNVRIIPNRIIFKGAYEGKHFKTKIVLQNIGKNIAFIRMATPTSCAYSIKIFPRGLYLSPGLCIERYIEFTYSQVCVKSSSLPLYINEERYDLEIDITTSSAELTVNPSFIDFGCLDAGLQSPPQCVELTNVGSKGTKYCFDIAGGKHEFLIEPSKGYIKAKQTIVISIRLLTYREGLINTEIWIRCDTPRMIAVQGLIITAKFEAIHPNATSKFTVIDFPTTYYKSYYTKRLLVRNYSSTNSMFCVLVELKDGRLMPFSTCKHIDNNLKFFEIYPSEGRFEPKETKLFHLTFHPKHFIDNIGRLKPYYFASFQICKVNYKDINPNEKIFIDPVLLTIAPHHNTSTSSFFADGTYATADLSLFRTESSAIQVNVAMKAERPFVRLYLHGLAENTNVTVIPDELILLEKKVNTKLTRVLELRNNSKNLPIVLHYKKVAYIDLERNIFLKPGEKKQITVFLTHHCIGLLKTQICFELIHYNSPKDDNNDFVIVGNFIVPVTLESVAIKKCPLPVINTNIHPNYIKEEGMFCEGLKYCDLMSKPKSIFVDSKPIDDKYRTDIIAFPNDRPCSLRPRICGSEKITTIFGKQPRYIPPIDNTYQTTVFEREFKREIRAYYTNFIRREADKLRYLRNTSLKAIEDEYSYAEKYKVNFNNVPMICGSLLNQRRIKGDCFLPLSPIELNMISVSPLVIETGKIACYYGYKLNLKITNQNSLALRLYFKPDSPSVLFPDSLRRIIHANSENEIEIDYMAGPPGYYVVTIDIYINESVITQVIIIADVVHHSLQLSTYNIQLDDGKYTEYITIINNLNTTINYFWDLPFCNFTVEPFSGSVRAYSSLMCVVIYYSHIGGPNIADLEFHSGDKDVQFVKVYCVIPDDKIELVTKSIKFENIPLNMRATRMIMFRNPLKQSLSYTVAQTELGDDLEVEPENGIIKGKLLLEISVSVTFQNCFKFSTVLVVDVTKVGKFEIPISGNVVYPAIKFIPNSLQFKGVPFSSTEFLKFDVKNCSEAFVKVEIDMSDYTEYIVSEDKFHWGIPPVDEFILFPSEIKTLYLHYMPMECSKSVFYLPVIINGILGPALMVDPISLKLDYHLKIHYKSVQEIPLPVNLEVLKITGLAKAGKISFSKLAIDFTLGIRAGRRYKTRYDLKITNCQKEHEDVCIRTDDLQTKPFVIESGDENVEIFESAVVCHLKAHQTAVLQIEFYPTAYGYYKTFLPFYLRSDSAVDFHNIIEVKGNYISPTIVGERLTFVLQAHTTIKEIAFRPVKEGVKKMIFYSRPIPLKVVACSTKKYLFRDHYKNCKIATSTNLPGLTMHIEWDSLYRLNDCDYEVEVTIKYSAEENAVFSNTVQITCSCGGSWNATVIGCAENCFLTSYAFAETFLPDHLEAFGMVSDSKRGLVSRSMTTMDLDSVLYARPSLMSAISRKDLGRIGTAEFHTMEFFSSYPFFPTEPSSLTSYLECCIDHMEEWVCNQCFYKTIRYQIPGTICTMVSISKSENIAIRSKKDRKVDFLVPPYVKLLINMVGPQMVSYLELGKAPKTEEDTCWYLYTVYDNAIRFIKSLGGYFICLKPEHLLTYDMFLAFKIYIMPTLGQNVASTSKSIKNYEEFSHLAKQSWLDLLLQTYKVLYLYRLNSILMVTTTDPLISPVIEPLENFKKSVKNFTRNANIFSNAELLLINWLEYHYTKSKKIIWDEPLPDKDVNFFGQNLHDGFVFAAVTGVYCPYMIPYLRKMIIDADMFEELLHNTCIVTRCWKMLNCSFAVKPEDILDPNSVHMLMLIAYLFEVLPSMYPYETIDFTIGLSQKAFNTIVLKNINDFPICYKVIFFSNEDNCFTTDEDMYVIPPGKSCKILITYYAKFAKNITCTLFLSGENDSYHFSRNRAFTLIGIPDVTYMTSTIKYPIYLYEVSDVSFTVKSPYSIETAYNIQLTYDMVQTPDDLANIPFAQKEELQTPSKFMPVSTTTQFDETGVFEFQAFCTILMYEEQSVYIYFRNPNVGDFAINFEIIMKESRSKEVIEVFLPKNVMDFRQSSTGGGLERVFLEIPCRNRLFWNTIMELMLRICEGDVLDFFKRNIGTTIGMQILQEIILGSGIDKSNLCDSVKYDIVLDNTDSGIILPDNVFIEDECSHNTISIPLKFLNTGDLPSDFTFSLISQDGRYRRYYVTNFTCDP